MNKLNRIANYFIGMKRRKSLSIGLWLTCLLAVGYLLSHEERFFALGGMPIAVVAKTSRDVTYRSEDDTKWKPVTKARQGVFDGDKISTGRQSSALIDFGDGRAASVGEDTSLSISTIRQSSGTIYILNLPKGIVGIQKVATGTRQRNQFPIIIRASGHDYSIEPGQERGIERTEKGIVQFKGTRKPKAFKPKVAEFKPAPIPVAVVEMVTALPVVEEPEPVVQVPVSEPLPFALVSESVPVPVVESPQGAEAPMIEPPVVTPLAEAPVVKPVVAQPVVAKPEVKKPPVVKRVRIAPVNKVALVPEIPEMDVNVALDASKLMLENFTFQSLASAKGTIGSLKWTAPKTKPELWQPAVEFANGKLVKQVVLDSSGVLKVNIEDFGPLTKDSIKSSLPCAVVGLRGGSKIDIHDKPRWSFGGKVVEVVVCSYRDAQNNVPLGIALSTSKLSGARREDLFTNSSDAKLDYQLIVTSPTQYLALLPLMAESDSIKVTSVSGMAQSGIFAVKDGNVVLQMVGPAVNPKLADQIRAVLSADTVFKGNKVAAVNGKDLNAENFAKWVSENLRKGKKIYIQKNGALIPISQKFMEERQEVAEFIKNMSSVFLEHVDLMAYK